MKALQEITFHWFWHADATRQPRTHRMHHVFGHRQPDRAQPIAIVAEGEGIATR